MTMQRKKIVWNSGETQPVRRLHLMPHIPNREASEMHYANLLPGALWRVVMPLMKDSSYPSHSFAQPPFPYLVHASSWSQCIPANTFVLYIGEVRVTEATQIGREVSVIRHCFMIDGMRYLTRDVNDFVPIDNIGGHDVI